MPLTFTTLLAISADNKFDDTFLISSSQQNLTFHANCLYLRQFSWNVKSSFLGKIRKLFQNVICWKLMFCTLWTISADNILMIRLFFPESNLKFWDNLHEMSNPVSLEKKKIFQNVCWKLMLSTLGTKFNIRHFEIFFIFFPENSKLFLWEKYHQFVIICGISPESDKGQGHWWVDSHCKVHLWDL